MAILPLAWMQSATPEAAMFCPACAAPLVTSKDACTACGRPSGTVHAPAAAVDDFATGAMRTARKRPPRYVTDLIYLLPLVLLVTATATMGVRAVSRHQAESDAYALGAAALANGQLLEAQRQFDAAGDYEDAPERAAEVERQIAPYASLYADGSLALKRG